MLLIWLSINIIALVLTKSCSSSSLYCLNVHVMIHFKYGLVSIWMDGMALESQKKTEVLKK